MKTKNYRCGKWTFKAYQKSVGHGYECGLTFNGKQIFVGNFIHASECSKWWAQMNREIRTFTKRYWTTKTTNATWYGKFFSTHLYKCYYTFLDRCFSKYNSTYSRQFNQGARRYFRMRKNWNTTQKIYSRAA